MGEKRASTRTLPSGEKVLHEPPSEEFPEGKMTLIPQGSSLRTALNANLSENQAREAELAAAQQATIDAKKAQEREAGLPPEKSVV